MDKEENIELQTLNASNSCISEMKTDDRRKERLSKMKRAAFLTTVTGFSAIFGFGFTVALAKKKDPFMFTKSLLGTRDLPESGASFAMRALAWGTFYSVAGVSAICFTVYKISGAESMKDFTAKIQSNMPKVPKKRQEQQGKSDFKTVRELVNYVIDEDKKAKEAKKS